MPDSKFMATETLKENNMATIADFVKVAQGIMDKNHDDNFPNIPRDVLSIAKGGRKYAKIVRGKEGSDQIDSVHCFVHVSSGGIFKAASFKAPAPHSRGNINDEDGGASAMTPYGAVYL